jgi:hypothetical protein
MSATLYRDANRPPLGRPPTSNRYLHPEVLRGSSHCVRQRPLHALTQSGCHAVINAGHSSTITKAVPPSGSQDLRNQQEGFRPFIALPRPQC